MKLQDAMIRKAAILVSSLDPELAKSLVRQFTPEEMTVVRHAMDDLESVAVEERAAVIDEFFATRDGGVTAERMELDDTSMASATDTSSLDSYSAGGVEWAGGTSDLRSHVATMASTEPPCETVGGRARPFHFLTGADSQSLVPFLRGERPQTVAVVLSYLSEERAAQVMSKLPVPQQVEVMERLADLDETDAESLGVVERELETWVEKQQRRHQRQAAGLAAVRGILSYVSAADEQAIVQGLRKKQSLLAGAVASGAVPTFDSIPKQPVAPHLSVSSRSTAPDEIGHDVPMIEMSWENMVHLDSASWAEVVREADPMFVVLALAGASDELFTRATRYLEKHDADAIAHERAHLGPTRLSDMSTAQEELAALAATLRRRKRELATSSS